MEEDDNALMMPEELAMHNALQCGIIAPPYQTTTTRVPWDPNNAPYYAYQPGVSHMERPLSRCYEQYYNGIHHNRKDFEEAVSRNRPVYQVKRGQAIYTGFTNEMTAYDKVTGDKMQTQHMDWTWMPKNPTDREHNHAALMAKALPSDPALFTPNNNFATAPGMDFRYSDY